MDKKDSFEKVKKISKDVDESKESEEIRKEMEEFEEGFPDGVYTAPFSPNEPRLKVRELYIYCREKGINPSELTPKEAEQFIVYPDRD
ncbi:hypothetical protein [Bacillus bombysepticus]|uniref:hypothetical protein n=1 Tax=Bacillus bombysepticus TaxID=658666 RepID=UPI003019BA2E